MKASDDAGVFGTLNLRNEKAISRFLLAVLGAFS